MKKARKLFFFMSTFHRPVLFPQALPAASYNLPVGRFKKEEIFCTAENLLLYASFPAENESYRWPFRLLSFLTIF